MDFPEPKIRKSRDSNERAKNEGILSASHFSKCTFVSVFLSFRNQDTDTKGRNSSYSPSFIFAINLYLDCRSCKLRKTPAQLSCYFRHFCGTIVLSWSSNLFFQGLRKASTRSISGEILVQKN